jgi:hypothetical protein
MKPSVLYYCAIALVILGSVLFGLDWQPAVLPPMAPIQVVALPPPPPVKIASPAQTPAPPVQAIASPPPAAPVAPVAPVAANPRRAQTPPKPLCDVAACAAAYRSFQESDCTYNPNVGPRRLCTKGVVPVEAAVAPIVPPVVPSVPSIANPEPGTPPVAEVNSEKKLDTACNVSACAAAYRSFRESDCTFNPNFGPRQHCAK